MASRSLLTNLDCTGQQLTGSPTIITPTVASFANATHSHTNSAGGGTLAEAALALTDITTNDVSTTKHGFTPKAPNDTAKFLRGDATWAAPPGSTLLTTVTASASATVDFTASIDSTYRRYLVRIDGLRPATDTTILMIRVSTDAGLTYKAGVADYSWVGDRNYSAGGGTGGDTSASEIRLGSPGTSSNNFMSSTANEFGSINVNIGHPSSGGHVPIWGDGAWFAFGAGVGISHCVFGGIYLTAGAINGIRFLMSTGNIAQGVFRLYGQN